MQYDKARNSKKVQKNNIVEKKKRKITLRERYIKKQSITTYFQRNIYKNSKLILVFSFIKTREYENSWFLYFNKEQQMVTVGDSTNQNNNDVFAIIKDGLPQNLPLNKIYFFWED